MGNRVPSRDLQFLITAILVQKETGGDLTEILERASHVIRERVRIEGEVRTHTAQGRLTGWILGLLPVIMLALINMVSPGYSSILFHDPLGQKLLYAGGTLIVLGGLIIRKIVDVQVDVYKRQGAWTWRSLLPSSQMNWADVSDCLRSFCN